MSKKQNNTEVRSPVVVVMGHVDHGKSSLLEKIKDLKITATESGGITQHIAAYEVEHEGKRITFIDTPGHEAFQEMRSRGARVADVAILVVDGTEGVKEQTKEAAKHIKEAGIPLVVAINKIDIPTAQPDWVKGELAKLEIITDDKGGDVPAVSVSAKEGTGLQDLLEVILLVAEMAELKMDSAAPARGVVIEANMDAQRGSTATVIMKQGQLTVGDAIGTPTTAGKVRSLTDFQGTQLAGAIVPSAPAVIVGFEKAPAVGETFQVYGNLKEAQKAIGRLQPRTRESVNTANEEDVERKVITLILKADVAGSLEAVEQQLRQLPQDKAEVKIVEASIGAINEKDVKLARSTKAVIAGFRVKADNVAKKVAERDEITIMTFDVIYELADAVKILLSKRLGSETVRRDLAEIKILAVFTQGKRKVIGGRVRSGEITKGVKLEIQRDGDVVGRGKVVSLQRNKKEIGKGVKGDEVGMLYEGTGAVEKGDIVVPYVEEKQKIELE